MYVLGFYLVICDGVGDCLFYVGCGEDEFGGVVGVGLLFDV